MIYGEFFLPLGREMERPRTGARTFVLQSFRGGIVACRQLLVGEGFFSRRIYRADSRQYETVFLQVLVFNCYSYVCYIVYYATCAI